MWEKDKLLVTSNFSFSHIFFKRHVLQTRKNQGLFGKGLSFEVISQQSVPGFHNALPNNKILDWNLKAFAHNTINMTGKLKFVLERVQNIVLRWAKKGVDYWRTWIWLTMCRLGPYLKYHTKFNPFLNNRILDMTKLKAFADDKMNVAKIMIYLFNWVENTVGKGENAG